MRNDKHRKESSAQDAFEQRQSEATEMLDSIENGAWDLWCDIRDFRVMLQNLEMNRALLDKS